MPGDRGVLSTGEAAGVGSASQASAVFTCLIPGPPVAQGRPRFTTRGGFARAYDPPKSRMWKRMAATLFRAERGTTAFVGPVQVLVIAVRACPDSAKRKRSVTPRRWDDSRTGDAENIAKTVLDAATASGLWVDDAQVARLVVERWVGAQDEAPSVLVEVRAL